MTRFSELLRDVESVIGTGGDPSALEQRVMEFQLKANETDPLKQTFGPEMRRKVLAMVEMFQQYKNERPTTTSPSQPPAPSSALGYVSSAPSAPEPSMPPAKPSPVAPTVPSSATPMDANNRATPMDIVMSPRDAAKLQSGVLLSPMDALLQCVEQVFALHGLFPPSGTTITESQSLPPIHFVNASRNRSMMVTFMPLGMWLLVYADSFNVKLRIDDNLQKVKTIVSANLFYPLLYDLHAPSISIFPPEVQVKVWHYLDLKSIGRLETCAKAYEAQDVTFSHVRVHFSDYCISLAFAAQRLNRSDLGLTLDTDRQPHRMACKRLVVAAIERSEMLERSRREVPHPIMPFAPFPDPAFPFHRDPRHIIGGPHDMFPGGLDGHFFPRQPRGSGGGGFGGMRW